MAIDLTLLDRAEQQGESWLRLYTWDPHCLSFGRNEPALRRYDVGMINRLGLDTVRRPTGGRAVWHARELTYAVAAPTGSFGSLQAAYLEIHTMLAEALRLLGVDAFLAPTTGSLAVDAGPCFAHPAGGEVMAANRKVVGSAQLRRGTALLQHGSILLDDDQRTVGALALARPGTDNAPARAMQAGALSAIMGRQLTIPEAAGAVTRAASASWGGAWNRRADPTEVLRGASRHYPQFRSSAWTWAR